MSTLFSDIAVRQNAEKIYADWFNDLRTAGIAIEAVTSSVDSSATPNTVVYRDSSGDFAAHNITANSFIGSGATITGTVAVTGGISYSTQLTSTVVTGTAPFVIASATLVANLYSARAALADTVTTNHDMTGPITGTGNVLSVTSQTGGGSVFVMQNTPTLTTPNIGAATGTSLTITGQFTSTLAIGTPPLVVTSTTMVSNLNANYLGGATFAAPTPIGSGTASTGAFTTLTSSSTTTLNGTTIPSSKTLTVTTDKLSVFASTSSSELAGIISDETGTGALVFGTAPTFTTSITAPLVIGGTGTTSPLILQSTSGVGTTGADIAFKVGNNGATEAMRILNSGFIGIGVGSAQCLLDVRQNGNSTPTIQAYNNGSQGSTGGAFIQLVHNTSAAAMSSGSRLGTIVYAGASDSSSTIAIGATIDALATEGWSSTANGSKLVFKVTANTTTTQSTALTLDQNKNATFTGTVTFPTPFTLGAVSVTSTGTQLNYLSSATGTTGTTSANLVFSASPALTGSVTITGNNSPLTLQNSSGGSSATQLDIAFNNSLGTEKGYLGFGAATDDFYVTNLTSSGNLFLRTNNTVALTINSSQNAFMPGQLSVGSTTALGYSLAVKAANPQLALVDTQTSGVTWHLDSGFTAAGNFEIVKAGVGSKFIIDTNGKVGIGAVPTQQLTISGGNLNFATSGKGILGTTTNDNTDAGNVGEYFSGALVPGSAVSLTDSTFTSLTGCSVALTAGDWDISAVGTFKTDTSVTGTVFEAFIGTASNASTGILPGDNQGITPTGPTSSGPVSVAIPSFRVSLSGNQTYYLNVYAAFSAGAVKAYGRISARRIR